jgi:hypothetical protein
MKKSCWIVCAEAEARKISSADPRLASRALLQKHYHHISFVRR